MGAVKAAAWDTLVTRECNNCGQQKSMLFQDTICADCVDVETTTEMGFDLLSDEDVESLMASGQTDEPEDDGLDEFSEEDNEAEI